MSMRLNKLAKFYKENDLTPSADHEMFISFIEKYGHRGTIELDLGTPRWREDPSYLVKQIETYMFDKAYEKNLKDMYEGAKRAENLTDEIYSKTLKMKGRKAADSLRKMIETYRIAAGMREYPKFNIVQGLEIARRVILDVAATLVHVSILDRPDDIFFLHKETILSKVNDLVSLDKTDQRWLVLKSEIDREIGFNKSRYKSEMLRTSIPRIVLNNGETFHTAKMISESDNVIQGFPLSSGFYEGIIRVVHDPLNAKLEQGEIMVAESTNPAWTPLFMTAKGLIMEYGGPLSHGGIVAREYGIPAVVGISSATSVFRNGQKVRIDGASGSVEILND